MSVKTPGYVSLAADTSRGPSPSLWNGLVLADFQQDPSLGMLFFDDFLVIGQPTTTNGIGDIGQWSCWADTNGVLAADPNQEGGVIILGDGGNTGVNVTMASRAGSVRLVSPATGFPLQAKVIFECRVAVGSITTAKRDAFIGLCDNTTSVTSATQEIINTTTNTLTTTNGLFGFHFRSTTNPTDVGLAYNVAGGTVQYPTNLQTLSLTGTGAALTAEAAGATGLPATGFIKLGFVYDPNPFTLIIGSASTGQTANTLAKPLVRIYVNGVPVAAFLTSTNLQAATFPTNFMGPAISYLSRSGTAPGNFYIDWIRLAALANY